MNRKNKTTLILKELITHFGFKSDAKFADFLGIAPQTLNSWRMRDAFDYDLVYSKCVGIDANWLLTGDGKMQKSDGEMLKSDVNPTVDARVSEMERQLTEREKKVSELQTEVQRLQKEVQHLQGEVQQLKDGQEKDRQLLQAKEELLQAKDKIIAMFERQNSLYAALERGSVSTKKSRQATEAV